MAGAPPLKAGECELQHYGMSLMPISLTMLAALSIKVRTIKVGVIIVVSAKVGAAAQLAGRARRLAAAGARHVVREVLRVAAAVRAHELCARQVCVTTG